jgi:uncharacterized iron-regulated membrane protein
MSVAMRRVLSVCIVTHRYVGMLLGILMFVWCLSGIVMMYVPYPSLDAHARLKALPPLNLAGCCKLPDDFSGRKVSGFDLTMVAEAPLLRVRVENERRPLLIDLRDGRQISAIGDVDALAVAARFGETQGYAGRAQLLRSVQYDQWTVEGGFRRFAPLRLYTWPDAKAPVLYVSGRDGEPVQLTERTQRFWNWLGSIPHWIYFLSLRENPQAWSQVVVYSSLAGCLLTLIGIFVGWVQWRRMRAHKRHSPYRGINFLHHVPGLIFGIFVLSWVASGLISMNPWGFLEEDDPYTEPGLLHGDPIQGAQVAALIHSLSGSQAAARSVSVQLALLNGEPKLLLTDAAGVRTRLDDQGNASPLTTRELQFVSDTLARKAPLSPAVLLSERDAYYFAHHRERPAFPVYRFISSDSDHIRYYIDPVTGELLRKVTPVTRGYRWLHEGMHRLDFIESRPLWDVVMLVLMAGVTFVCATGAIMSITVVRKSFTAKALRSAADN